MSKKEVRPDLVIKHLLTPKLTREDFVGVMSNVNAILRSSENWKYHYRETKKTLSSQLTQEQYQRVIKQLNIIVRPYRQKELK
ncbi:MAG TPA: hypothetical protein VEP90_10215 [Methylomirabilota bacterium]|nr:hypothetical protein [Methylomirabilota bacterium]